MWLTTVDDGAVLPQLLPIVSGLLYRQKHYAYLAWPLGLNTRVTMYDTETFTRRLEFETPGAFVAGVFPPSGPADMPAPLPTTSRERRRAPTTSPSTRQSSPCSRARRRCRRTAPGWRSPAPPSSSASSR